MKQSHAVHVTAIVLSIVIAGCKSDLVLYSDVNYDAVQAVSLDEYKSQQQRNTKLQDPDVALGVAISGGGSRAEYFGLGALLGLETITNRENTMNVLGEVDYFSTISGGGLAAGYYLSFLKNVQSKKPYGSFNAFWLSPLRIDTLQEFFWQSATPLGIFAMKKYERGKWENMPTRLDYEVLQYDKTGNRKFKERMLLSDFFIPGSDPNRVPKLPMLVATGTIYGNAERLPFMPHILKSLKLDFISLPNDELKSNDPYDLPAAYAIGASASFPGILPHVKFNLIDNPDSVVRVIDGGVVENLGYGTLLELLNADKAVKNQNKKAIVIDCSGLGKPERFSKNQTLGAIELISDALLFTVDSKYLNQEEGIRRAMTEFGIPAGNQITVGFSTIREAMNTAAYKNDKDFRDMKTRLRSSAGRRVSNKVMTDWWEDYYYVLETNLQKHIPINTASVRLARFPDDNNLRYPDLIDTDAELAQITKADVLLLYELAARVDTKMKIYRLEKSMLMLAGRYAVYLQRDKIKTLYQSKAQ